MKHGMTAIGIAVAALAVLGACSQAAPPAPTVPAAEPMATSAVEGITPVGTVQAHFDPTEAVGGGANSSTAVGSDELTKMLATVSQASQLRITANASPPNAPAADVSSVSILAQDSGGALSGLDAAGKRTLADSILTAAATAWPNASISLLISTSGGGGPIIGSRPKGGPNTVIAS